MDLRALLDTTFYGNTLLTWLMAAGVLVIVMAVLMFVRRMFVNRVAQIAARTTIRFDDFLVDVLKHTHALFLFIVALSAATLVLVLPPDVPRYVRMLLGAAFIIQVLIWGNEGIAFWLRSQAKGRPGALGTVTAIAFMVRLLLWAVMLLLLLDNFGVQVTTLIAALGVTGIAVALAAQTVLGDLFAAISIYLDKPFEVGDFIIFDEYLGSVRDVGLRSTRIDSLSGEELVISNSDLLKTRIHNYKRMVQRRVAFQVGVAYGTSREIVASIPGIIRSAVEEQKSVRFDRSHLKEFGESSLNYETVFYVLSPDYNIYMDIQQAINFKIMQRFEEQNIAFAHPIRVMTARQGKNNGENETIDAAAS